MQVCYHLITPNWEDSTFNAILKWWEQLSRDPGTTLIELSPWGYFTARITLLLHHQRQQKRALLAALVLPALFLILQSSG